MKKTLVFLLTALAVMATSAVAFAQGTADIATSGAIMGAVGMIAIGAGVGIGLAAVGPGIGMGLTMFSALQGIARNPEVTRTLQVNMFIGMALLESLTIYGLVVSLILIYAFPLSSLITG